MRTNLSDYLRDRANVRKKRYVCNFKKSRNKLILAFFVILFFLMTKEECVKNDFRRNQNKKYYFENNTTDAQKIISRKMDEMELNKNHSGQVWFHFVEFLGTFMVPIFGV